jgi:NADH-quinone oxidoreductase subunit F
VRTGKNRPVPPFLLPRSPITSFDQYLATGYGGLGLQRAQALGPDATIEELRRAGLRGRGGAGFPTARKWAGVRGQSGSRRYLVANGAEGEPGTFKDRALLRANPYQLVEGVIIAGSTVGAEEAFICLKRSFEREIAAVTRAVQEFQGAGVCADCTITVVAGPEEYLFGEEKAMLEVIEGNAPMPRLLPPHEHGLFATAPQTGWQATSPREGGAGRFESNPTLVNNVETLSNVTHVLARGADWFRTMGSEQSPGTLVCTVAGDVVAPDVGEVELGTPLRAVIDAVGSGVGAGRQVKAVFSGVSNAVVTAEDLDVALTYEGFAEIGSGMGAGGYIVYDDTACMVEVARQFSRFLHVESCGQCPPCKEGSAEITHRLELLESGQADQRHVEEMGGWLARVTDANRCYLGTEEQTVVSSILRAFPGEFAEHLDGHGCPRPRSLPFPKIVDLVDGRAIYDPDQHRKQPDWTYR